MLFQRMQLPPERLDLGLKLLCLPIRITGDALQAPRRIGKTRELQVPGSTGDLVRYPQNLLEIAVAGSPAQLGQRGHGDRDKLPAQPEVAFIRDSNSLSGFEYVEIHEYCYYTTTPRRVTARSRSLITIGVNLGEAKQPTIRRDAKL